MPCVCNYFHIGMANMLNLNGGSYILEQMMLSPLWQPIRFDHKNLPEKKKRIVGTLW